MAISREKKAEILKHLQSEVLAAPAVVLVSFHKLTAAAAASLRQSLKKKHLGLTVVKKTLLARALGVRQPSGEIPVLEGSLAVVYGAEPLEAAKSVHEFGQQFKDTVKFLGGILAGRFADADTIGRLAVVPDRQTLYGQLAYVLASPLKRLAIALDQIARQKSG